MTVSKKAKLALLAENRGQDTMEMLEEGTYDCIAAGICMNIECDYDTDVEPDQDQGWCELCCTNTVVSCLMLAGIV